MIIDRYETQIAIDLEPIWHDEKPLVVLECFDQKIETYLERRQEFQFVGTVKSGNYALELRFLNKKDQDTLLDLGKDKAVIIKSIRINEIQDPRFVWNGLYQPEYPEPWYSQQDPKPQESLPNTDYLGWNGIWRLEFSVPAFQWIHHTLDLGWIYD